MVRLDDFDGTNIDRTVWLAHYLPAWSSLDRTAARWAIADSVLTLTIPVDHPRWCPEEHPEPLRVSGIQSGNRSGPVGSADGQQRFRDGLVVREAQPRFVGWLTSCGRLEIRMRMELSPRSMAAMWLAGFEERPLDAGELCVVEVFGRSIDPGRSAEIGMGVKAINDPRLTDDFTAPGWTSTSPSTTPTRSSGTPPPHDSGSTATRSASATSRPRNRCRS